jgi:hypothetical protein
MIDLAREEERWLSLAHEKQLHEKLNELKNRRRYLNRQPMTCVNLIAARALEQAISDVADEYWITLNYNRAKGWMF